MLSREIVAGSRNLREKDNTLSILAVKANTLSIFAVKVSRGWPWDVSQIVTFPSLAAETSWDVLSEKARARTLPRGVGEVSSVHLIGAGQWWNRCSSLA